MSKIPFTAATDLRAYQWRAINIGGTLGGASLTSHGLLYTKPNSGEDGTIICDGRSKFVAGGSVSKGDRLAVAANGYLTAAGSGDTSVGFAETSTTSGSVGRGYFDFAAPAYHSS